MYAIIRAGGKQHKVAKGDVIEVERINDATTPLSFQPLLLIDDDGGSRTSPSELAAVTVTASIVGDAKGPKIHVYKYKNKTGYRRHTGHRQKYTTIRIDDIKL
ncbi:MAG TPA: 50S ribosomal protein L21 [Actinomycetota bacterium]|nr:50S ribosomal protein L21 [Actinomycetota bacterium]